MSLHPYGESSTWDLRGLRRRTATHVFGGGPFAMSSAVPRGKEWKRYPCAEEHEKMSELYLQTLVPAYLCSTLSCDNCAIFFFCVCVEPWEWSNCQCRLWFWSPSFFEYPHRFLPVRRRKAPNDAACDGKPHGWSRCDFGCTKAYGFLSHGGTPKSSKSLDIIRPF